MVRVVSSFILLFLILSMNISYGSNSNVPGYIITHNNDTIEGTILIKDWNPETFEGQFHEGGSVDGIIVTPSSVKEFGVGNEVFKSAIVMIEQSSTKTTELSKSSMLDYMIDTVFLQVVIEGEKELLYLKDDNRKNSFYIKQDIGYTWLVHKKYETLVDGKKKIVSNNNYIGQLIVYLEGCKSMNRVLSGTTYDFASLVKAFKYYYDCTNLSMKQVKDEKNTTVEISGMAGISITKIGFNGVGADYLTKVEYPWSPNFTGGISANINLPQYLGRWSINNEFVISSFSANATYQSNIDDNRYTITQTELGSVNLKLNNMFRANFYVNYTYLFFDVGIFNGFSISNTNYKKTTTVVFASETVVESTALNKMRNHEIGLLIGVGVRIKKVSGVFRYEIGNGISGSNDIDSSLSRFYLLIGYRFM